MELKTSLSQKQKLALSTYMQQSLEVLQMDATCLRERILAEMEKNLILETRTDDGAALLTSHIAETDCDIKTSLELQYEDGYRSDVGTVDNLTQDLFAMVAAPGESLTDHLIAQLSVMNVPEKLAKITRYLIFCLDDDGRLLEPAEEISEELQIEISEVRAAIDLLQSMEPAGVGAADYKECLLLQAKRLGLNELVLRILESDKYLEYLAKKRTSKIAEDLNVSSSAVTEAYKKILSLDPNPGQEFGNGEIVYIIPDIQVEIDDTGFSIAVGNRSIPDVQINGEYVNELKVNANAEMKQYLDACLKNAQALINGMAQRNKTLFLCAAEIVRRQPDFFKYSSGTLVPMTLGDIAESLSLSVSTVSRAVKNKYISCRHGTLPLRALFTTGIMSQNVPESSVSSQRICKMIRRLIEHEDKKKPLSDPDIARVLMYRGYQIARRTVTKYRNKMKIPSVSRRRIR